MLCSRVSVWACPCLHFCEPAHLSLLMQSEWEWEWERRKEEGGKWIFVFSICPTTAFFYFGQSLFLSSIKPLFYNLAALPCYSRLREHGVKHQSSPTPSSPSYPDYPPLTPRSVSLLLLTPAQTMFLYFSSFDFTLCILSLFFLHSPFIGIFFFILSSYPALSSFYPIHYTCHLLTNQNDNTCLKKTCSRWIIFYFVPPYQLDGNRIHLSNMSYICLDTRDPAPVSRVSGGKSRWISIDGILLQPEAACE